MRTDIFLDDVKCIGDESSLLDCEYKLPNQSNCDRQERAGVNCTSTSKAFV